MWIIGISKLNRNISCFTVYDQPTTNHWGNRTFGTSKRKSYLICLNLPVNVLLFSDFNALGVLNNNGTPCLVISLTCTFFLSFLEWSKLWIITGDFRWFIWRGKFFSAVINFHCKITAKIKQFQRILTFYAKVKKDTTQDKKATTQAEKDFWGSKGTKRGHSGQKGKRGTFLPLFLPELAWSLAWNTRVWLNRKVMVSLWNWTIITFFFKYIFLCC